jgi:transcriptional regulator with XRE-family HTH domain
MDAMAEKAHQLKPKLQKLWQGFTQEQIAERIGVSRSQVKQYLATRNPATPGPWVLVRIADQFGVSVRWLLDDTQPVDTPASEVQQLKSGDLIHELARRYREELVDLLDAIEAAEQEDAFEAARLAFSHGLEGEWPHEVDSRLANASHALQHLEMIASSYSIEDQAYSRYDELPGSDRNPDDLLLSNLAERARQLLKNKPELRWLERYAELRGVYKNFPGRRGHYQSQVPKFLSQIENKELPDPMDNVYVVDQQAFDPGSARTERAREIAKERRDKGYSG